MLGASEGRVCVAQPSGNENCLMFDWVGKKSMKKRFEKYNEMSKGKISQFEKYQRLKDNSSYLIS